MTTVNPFPWWRHQMETFSTLLAICVGNSPHKGQWRGALMFSLICVWINDWVNNCEAGDLRHYRTHYDITVMQVSLAIRDLVQKIFCPEHVIQMVDEISRNLATLHKKMKLVLILIKTVSYQPWIFVSLFLEVLHLILIISGLLTSNPLSWGKAYFPVISPWQMTKWHVNRFVD